MLLISLVCHTPIAIRGQHVNLSPFSGWNVRNNWCWCVQLMLSERVLACRWCLVAFMKAMNLLHWLMRSVTCCCIAMAIKNGHQSGYILHQCFVDCCLLGSHRGDTEQVVTWCSIQWLQVCIGWCHMYHFNTSAWPSKWPAMEVCHSSPPPFLLGVIVTKDHVMVHLS